MLNVAVVADPTKAAGALDFNIVIELAKVLGFPALLFYLLFLFLKQNERKWESLMVQHKEERDRDYGHLKELMETMHGQFQAMSMLSHKADSIEKALAPLNTLGANFRDLHARFDNLPIFVHKESHVGSPPDQRPPLRGKDQARPS